MCMIIIIHINDIKEDSAAPKEHIPPAQTLQAWISS